ncbi:MAG: hypothetical protein ACLSXY_07255 [Veillonella sp.]
MQGTIVKALAGFIMWSAGRNFKHAPEKFPEKGQTPYVGDKVEFSAEENSEGYI